MSKVPDSTTTTATMPVTTSRWDSIKHALSSPKAFHEAIKLDDATALINEDLAPSPPARHTWTTWNFFAYWWSESWAVSTWSLGSSMITLGATVRDALLVVLFANVVSAVVIVLNGRAAERYHIGYPVLSRVSFGMYGSYFVVVLRAILGIIWGGVQLYFEGQFIAICLRCVFSTFDSVPNTIPASQYTTTQIMIGYFLGFVFTLPFMFIHTTKIRHLFTAKSIILPIACLGVVCWATSANGGVSANQLEDTAVRPSVSVFAWGICAFFNSVMGANSALIVTVPDLARYSKTKNAQVLGQALGLPFAQTICAAFGIITTSAVKNMWGTAYWNPYDLLNGILDEGYTPKARAGVFFASASFAFATLGTSIACNITPFAADVSCLAPKYINIIRGQFLCLLIAFAIVPWRIVATANGFLTFLSGYSIFQGPVVGVMVVDYFFSRRGNIDLRDVYTAAREGRYYYTGGVNLRAFAAFIIGFSLPLPGFIGSFGSTISTGAVDMFDIGWALSFAMGTVSYLIICAIWPVPGGDRALKFEARVEEANILILEGVGLGHHHEAVGDGGSASLEESEKSPKDGEDAV